MFIDTHAHTYTDKFKDDLDEVIALSLSANVDKVLLPNIDSLTIDKLFSLCDSYPEHFYPMVGLHPCSVNDAYKNELNKLEPYLEDERVIAIGETGTDLYWDQTYKDQQFQALEIQISWALDLDLPIVLHSRDSIDMSIDIISKFQNGSLRGVFHCFGGSAQQAQQIMDLGFFMGIGGTVTFKSNKALRETLIHVPLTSILLETDAPYLTPHPYRGKRNNSSYIPLIGETLSNIYEEPIENIAKVTSLNASKLFGLS